MIPGVLAAASAGAGAPSNIAAIVIGLGQSLNVKRGGSTETATPGWDKAFMPVGGCSVIDFPFSAANEDNQANAASFASMVPYNEGTGGQSPFVGTAMRLAQYPECAAAYLCSVAVGARRVQVLMSRGERANVHAAVKSMCAAARAAGYVPRVFFDLALGEANGSAGTSEAVFSALLYEYLRFCQMIAAIEMGDKDYVAPVILQYPLQNANPSGDGAYDRAIRRGLKTVAETLPGAIMYGPIIQWGANTDRVHPPVPAYPMRGDDKTGRIIGDILAGNPPHEPLKITGVTLSGVTAVVTFSHNIARDATLNTGESLNAANACDGIEWIDIATFIAVNSAVYSGANQVTLTLNSAPVGPLSQQTLRIGNQAMTNSLTSGQNNLNGSLIRKAGPGRPSIYNPAFTNHDYACPQECIVEAA